MKENMSQCLPTALFFGGSFQTRSQDECRIEMKHLLLTTIAAVVLVGCGPSVDIHEAAATGNIEAVKQYIAAGTDLNVKNERGLTPLDRAILHNINNQRHK